MDAATEVTTVVGVLVILIGVIVYNNIESSRAAKRARAKQQDDPAGTASPGFIGKFAIYQGAVVGQVVAEEGDQLLLTQAGLTRIVARKAARVEGHDVVLTQAPQDR